MKRKCLAIGIILLFIIANLISVSAQNIQKTRFLSQTKTISPAIDSFRNETELKYYQEDNLSLLIGLQGPGIWKSAIRLTQMELAPYKDWTLTKVNVAFNADNGCPWIDIRIYIYDTGNATDPGPVIANDTTRTLNVTGIITIPLVTSVDLSGHEELWIAVEWDQTVVHGPGEYYAWMDTITGPAVDGKGDWLNLNNVWEESQHLGGEYDGNWGIGAIIDGPDLTELSIGNIEKGYSGFTAEVQNTGDVDALNLTWSYTVKGGILHHNKTATGTDSSLVAHGILSISVPIFILFGKINIAIYAQATNAPEVNVRLSSFVLGIFLLGIKYN